MSKTTPARGSIAAMPNIKIKHHKSAARGYELVDPAAPVEPLEADWADGNLDGLECVVRPGTAYKRAHVWEGIDGTWFRRGGAVTLRRGKDGEFRFIIYLYPGANEGDYRFLERVVHHARDGALLRHGWDTRTDENDEQWWSYACSREYLTPDQSPYTTADPGAQLLVCTDNRCTDAVHESSGDDHTVDVVEAEQWRIEVSRYVDRDGEQKRYEVGVTVEANLTPTQVASLVNDLQWAGAVCHAVNGKTPDPAVKGIRNPEMYWVKREALEASTVIAA